MGKRNSASKFPVARIKKIMQADEEIGKVAQATPVVICELSTPSAQGIAWRWSSSTNGRSCSCSSYDSHWHRYYSSPLVAKALELFLADLVGAAVKESKSKGARKVTAYHLW